MTAINVICTPNAAHFYSDGALLDQVDGKMLGVYCKQTIIPHLPAAIAVAGQVQIAKALMSELGGWQASYDDFKGWMGREFRSWYAPAEKQLFKKILPNPNSRKFTIIIAGWGKSGPDAFTVGNDDEQGEPWKIYESRFIVQPGDAEVAKGFQRSQFDPHGDGIKLMQRQRELMRFHSEKDGKPYCGIGGFIQHTTIKRENVSSWISYRWPDKVGDRI